LEVIASTSQKTVVVIFTNLVSNKISHDMAVILYHTNTAAGI